MEIEGNKPDPSIFAHVVYLAVGALVVIIVAAIIIVTWRGHKKNTPPYTKRPTAQLSLPSGSLNLSA